MMSDSDEDDDEGGSSSEEQEDQGAEGRDQMRRMKRLVKDFNERGFAQHEVHNGGEEAWVDYDYGLGDRVVPNLLVADGLRMIPAHDSSPSLAMAAATSGGGAAQGIKGQEAGVRQRGAEGTQSSRGDDDAPQPKRAWVGGSNAAREQKKTPPQKGARGGSPSSKPMGMPGPSTAADRYAVGALTVPADFAVDEQFEFHSGAHNDVLCSLAFMAVVVGTLILALKGAADGFGIVPPVEPVTSTCTQPCQNGGTCSERGDFCDCALGSFGDFCEESVQVTLAVPNATEPEPEPEPEPEAPAWRTEQLQLLLVTLVVAAVPGGLATGAGVALLRRFPERAVVSPFVMLVGVQLGAGVGALVAGYWVPGVLLFLGAGFSCVALALMRRWVPFATAMLRTSSEIVAEYPRLMLVAFGAMLVQLLWLAIWSLAMIAAVSDGSLPSALAMCLSLFWTTQVIKNVVHMTAAGVAAAWYHQALEPHAVRHSLKRALTTSFGSVCFGSLVVASLESVAWLSVSGNRGARTRGQTSDGLMACLLCCCSVMGKITQWVMEVLNGYAYVQVAIYGFAFVPAAKACWALLKDVGLLPLVHNKLLGLVLFMGSLMSGTVAAVAGTVFVAACPPLRELSSWGDSVWLHGSMCFVVGWLASQPAKAAVEATHMALFVCFAQSPGVLAGSRPELFGELNSGYKMVTGVTFDDDGASDDEDREEYGYEYEYEYEDPKMP